MNYAAIYQAFIEDRRAKEPALKAARKYVERHHIVPRSQGGTDEAENLVSVTPEDHYFAHLLLAHIHGGWAWSAVKAMCNGWSSAESKWRRNRPIYGVARRRWAAHAKQEMKRRFAAGEMATRKGVENNKFNPEEFAWFNLDTEERRVATMHAMHLEFGGSRPSWTSVVTGDRKTILGWKLEGSEVRIRGLKGKVFRFVNRDGRMFSGTQQEFCQHVGLSAASGTRVCRDQSVTRCGWRLEATEDRPHFAQKSDGVPARRNSGAEHTFVRGDEVRRGKVGELAALFGSTKPQMHAGISQIKNGNVKGYKGWGLRL